MSVKNNYSQYKGLTDAEVRERLSKTGYNELLSSKPHSFLQIMLAVISEPMFILLVSCAGIYMLLGDIHEGFMLLGFVLVVMGIELYQEQKSERALDALKDLASPRAMVIRNGCEERIAGREVVIDDIIVLQEGDRVPADVLILTELNLLIDESLLTGESIAVRKREWRGEDYNIPPGGDDLPFAYSSTMVIQGNAIARVIRIGMDTEIGKIGKEIESTQETPSKMKVEIGVLVKRLAIIGFILCGTIILVYYFTRGDLLKGFLAGITLAMAVMPEEYPVILTIFMALGAWRISKKRVLARRSSAIETLGSATVLCSDKTGTITQNSMQVVKLYNGSEFWNATQPDLPEPFHQLIEYGILSSQENPFDAMEKAIIRMGQQHLEDTEHIHPDWEMLKEYPLSKEMMAMSHAFRSSDPHKEDVAAKGAPEAIFDLCHLLQEEQERLSKVVHEMASVGLRVLGVANATLNVAQLPANQHDFEFRFVGLIALSDPIRPEVSKAVQNCREAGIRVVMITGDYPITGMNIAREIGLANPNGCLTGVQLKEMSDQELTQVISQIDVFARVLPDQKLKIVNALKRNNEIVAMTGDGVNDAPALKAAHIGIAMGEKGTDVAREASALVLMDDNFASIVEAIRMGRQISDNLQKSMGYIFAIHVPLAGLSLIPVFFAGWPLILWPIHVAFMQLIIDPSCSILYDLERAETNIMNRPPRSLNEPFFGAGKILISCIQGLCILVTSLSVYLWAMKMGYPEGEIRAMTFSSLIVANVFTIITNRSWHQSFFSIIKVPNRAMWWVLIGASSFLFIALKISFFQKLFQFTDISFQQIVISMLVGALSISWFEIYKQFIARKTRKS